jgi:DNA-nicking Smr family endonuclease
LNSKISDKDKKDWENFLSNNEKLHDKDNRPTSKREYLINSIDLHGFTLEDANKKIKEIIISAYNQGVNKIIVVTGKGLHSQNEKDPYVSKDYGILKYSVPDYIKNDSELMKMIIEIKDASIEDGGKGAFYIFIKRKFIK